MSRTPVKIGFLGGGMMCQVGHLPFYRDDPRCEIACVAESRPSLVAALAAVVGEDRIVADHRAMLNMAEIDAVVISAPRPATGPLTLEALSAGKHVLAEKPMAHTAEQARRLVEVAEEKNLHYSVGYMKRFDPGIKAAVRAFEELTQTGRLGELLLARFYDFSKSYAGAPPPHTRPAESRAERFDTWPLWPDWLPESYRETYAWFLNTACHDVNLLRLFFPAAQDVIAAHCLVDGSVSAVIDADGVPVHLEIAKTAAGRWLEGGEFLFERGRLRFTVPSPMDMTGVTQVRIDDEAGGLPDQPVETERGWSFARQARGFLDALIGSAPLRNPGAEGLQDLRLSEAIWRQVSG